VDLAPKNCLIFSNKIKLFLINKSHLMQLVINKNLNKNVLKYPIANRNLASLFQYISNKKQRCTVYFIWKLLYMFRVVLPPIIRSTKNCIYSIWYLSHRYCHLPLSWKSWNWFECAVGGLRHSPRFRLFHDSGR
jgi:hypothetical protein